MDIRVKSLKFDADQKLLDFVQKKVARLERFDDQIIGFEVTLSLQERPENKVVKLTASIPGDDIIIERDAQTFEEAVNDAVDAMKEKIVRTKEKREGR